MTEPEIRIRALELAIELKGNPQHVSDNELVPIIETASRIESYILHGVQTPSPDDALNRRFFELYGSGGQKLNAAVEGDDIAIPVGFTAPDYRGGRQ